MTFNLGLLRIKLLGKTVFSSPPFVPERFDVILKRLPALLAAQEVDVCALQEIYEPEHVSALLQAVKREMPYHARGDNNGRLQFHNGLLFLSRTPIEASALVKHSQSSALERWFGCKSCLGVRLHTHLGKIALVNLHTTAGGGVDPASGGVDSVRQSELEEGMALCERARADGYASAIIGDLNMSPEASRPNYDFLLTAGYRDAVEPFAKSVGCTWDPTSPLNNLPVFAGSPPQRIDHLFLHKEAGVAAQKVEKLFVDACVDVPAPPGQAARVPLSDHYALVVDVVPAHSSPKVVHATYLDPRATALEELW